MKSIHTLVDDIYNLFTPGNHEISEEFVEELGRQVLKLWPCVSKRHREVSAKGACVCLT